jgi:cellulose/xylan binding protein with CBM9 domain
MDMKKHMQKIPGNVLFVTLLLLFMGTFSYFRSDIADYAAWLLAMTHEITLSKAKAGSGESRPAMQIITENKFAANQKKKSGKTVSASKKRDDRFKKPVTANLPKTKTPTISFGKYFPEWDDPELTLFTPLRKYDGTIWQKEKTEIKGSTDGKKLYLICRFYDQNPNEAVTANTAANAWKDDSIEVFLMKNRKSKNYCQYIVSVTGKGCTLCYKNNKTPNSYTLIKRSRDFAKPRYGADDFDGGFEIEMAIALSNIGIDKIKPGDSFLMQITRNYRGQGYRNSVNLQLFPAYIYADNRMGAGNHDRRAFQRIVVKKGK